MTEFKPLDDRLRKGLYPAANFDPFPFHAYDDYGKIILPDEVEFPAGAREQLDAALSAPMWKAIFRSLSVLDTPSTWNCYSVGINYLGDSMNLLIGKSIDTVEDADAGRAFCESLGNTLLDTIQQAAGTQWAIDHQLVNGLRAVLAALMKQLGGGGGGGVVTPSLVEPGGGTAKGPARDGGRGADAAAPRGGLEVRALSPVLALELMVSLAEFALTMTKPRRITAAILWYLPDDWPSYTTKEILKTWDEIGDAKEIWDGSRRVSSCVWNPEYREVRGWEDEGHWLNRSPKMVLSPKKIQQFLYPAGDR